MIELVPDTPPVFDFIARHANATDQEMYATFNMGAGFAIYVPEQDAVQVIAIAKRKHLKAWRSGYIMKGKRQVVIKSKAIIFSGETLRIRN